MTYDLTHLTQTGLLVFGPIQDDEALALYGLCRVLGVQRVLEFGYLSGYSATNFLAAIGPGGRVYSVDCDPFVPLANNHTAIVKDCATVTPADVDDTALDLIFFDCHSDSQLTALDNLAAVVADHTLLAVHDTGCHDTVVCEWSQLRDEGWAHQPCERRLVNALVDRGWHAVCLHPPRGRVFLRHGLTLLRKFKPLL